MLLIWAPPSFEILKLCALFVCQNERASSPQRLLSLEAECLFTARNAGQRIYVALNLRFFDAIRLLCVAIPGALPRVQNRWYVAYKEARLLAACPAPQQPLDKVS